MTPVGVSAAPTREIGNAPSSDPTTSIKALQLANPRSRMKTIARTAANSGRMILVDAKLLICSAD